MSLQREDVEFLLNLLDAIEFRLSGENLDTLIGYVGVQGPDQIDLFLSYLRRTKQALRAFLTQETTETEEPMPDGEEMDSESH